MFSSLAQKFRRFTEKNIAFQLIAKCQKGSSFVEFAFAGPVIIIMIVGIMEIAMIMFVNALVEGGVRDAARLAITGNVDEGVSREEMIIDRISEVTMGLIELGPTNVTLLIYPSFEDVGQPEPYSDDSPANGSYDAGESYSDINGNGSWDSDMGAAGAGEPGDIVIYRVDYTWPLMLGLLADSLGTSIDMQASIAVRNEPWSS